MLEGLIKGPFTKMLSVYVEATEIAYYYRANNHYVLSSEAKKWSNFWNIEERSGKGCLGNERCSQIKITLQEWMSAVNATTSLSSLFSCYLFQASPLAIFH